MFSKHWYNCICFVYFSILTYCIKEGIKGNIFWTLNLKVLAYEAATAWNRGIPCKTLNFLIKLYLVLLNVSKRLSEVRYFEIKWICWPMRQIQPETGEYLVFFFKTLIQLYLLRSFLYSLTHCTKEVIKGKIFLEIKWKRADLWGSYGLKKANPLQFFQNTDPIVFVLFIFLFLTYCIKEGIKGKFFGSYI